LNTIPTDGEATEPVALAFPPEHYGCPPWCTVNKRIYPGGARSGHDSADSMPGSPGFCGYYHWTSLYIPYGPNANVSVHLSAAPGEDAVISVGSPNDSWTEFTLSEAENLAAAISEMAEAGRRTPCPSWCSQSHDRPDDDGWHNGSADVAHAWRAGDGEETAGPYHLDMTQDAPEIELCDARHGGALEETVTLTLADAERVAAAITELAAAAREGRPVSDTFADAS
jgi:hypothetical protein